MVMTFCGAMQGLQSYDKKSVQWKYLLPTGLVSSYIVGNRVIYLVEKEGTPSMKQELARLTLRQQRVGFFFGGMVMSAVYAGFGYAGASMFCSTFADPPKNLE